MSALFTQNDNPNEMSSESQKKQIRKYLEEGETITQVEALKLFRCFRLASRMNDLKRDDVPFDSVRIQTPTGKYVKAYFIPEAFAKRHGIEADEQLAGRAGSYAGSKISSI